MGVQYTTSDFGSAISTWTVGHVVSRSQSCLSAERTACERRKRKSCRKALAQFDEFAMFVTIERPKDKGETQKCVGIVLDLVDRSDEVVVRTTERVVGSRIV